MKSMLQNSGSLYKTRKYSPKFVVELGNMKVFIFCSFVLLLELTCFSYSTSASPMLNRLNRYGGFKYFYIFIVKNFNSPFKERTESFREFLGS